MSNGSLKVYKQLAAKQDLALGKGKVTQNRNGNNILVDKFNPVESMTLAEAQADETAYAGKVVIISDRTNGLFEFKTGQTPNGYDIVQSIAIPSLSLELRLKVNFTPSQVGAIPKDINADNLGSLIRFFELTTIKKGLIDSLYACNGSIDLPSGVNVGGIGAHTIQTFITTDDKLNLSPNKKGDISGGNLIFTGSATKSYATNRADKYGLFSYGLSYLHLTPLVFEGVGLIQDMDVYNSNGELTTQSTDNRADYDCGLILRSQQSRLNGCNIFGYWENASLTIHSQQDLENVDSDYNKAIDCIFTSVSLIGDTTTNNGLTGFYGMGCGYYNAADHHNYENGDGDYSLSSIYIDGDNGIAGIRGHKFDGNLRTRANNSVVLDKCNDITLDFYANEVPTLTGVPGADSPGSIVGTANTNDVYVGYSAQSSTNGLGIYDLANTIAGSVISIGGEDNKTLLVSKGGKAVKIGIGDNGDSIVQLTTNSDSDTDGWIIARDESQNENLSLKYNNSELFQLDTNGNLSVDGNVTSKVDVNVGNKVRFDSSGDIRSSDEAEEIRFRNGNTSALNITQTEIRPGGNNTQTSGSSSFAYQSIWLYDEGTQTAKNVAVVNGILVVT